MTKTAASGLATPTSAELTISAKYSAKPARSRWPWSEMSQFETQASDSPAPRSLASPSGAPGSGWKTMLATKAGANSAGSSPASACSRKTAVHRCPRSARLSLSLPSSVRGR